MDRRYKSPDERLARYSVSETGCWEWDGALYPGGYGHISPMDGEVQAHRASYARRFGKIPKGMCVLHSCDNRRCINPDHLRLGTHTDNQNDAYRRGRRPRFNGSTSANAKLTEAQALKIKSDKRKLAEVAAEYGVSTSLVSAIRCGTAWRHLDAWRTANATERAKMNLR